MQLTSILSYQRVVAQPQIIAGYYHGFIYYLALVIVFLPITVFETFIFVIIIYPMAGLVNGIGSTQFGYLFITSFMINQIARSFIILLATVLNSQAAVSSLAGVSTVMFSIFSGFMAPKNTIPTPWIWMYYCNYYTYSIRGLAINDLTAVGNFNCPPLPQACLIRTGQDALRQYDMAGPPGEKWDDLSYLAYFWVGFNALAAIGTVVLDFTPVDKEAAPDFEILVIPEETAAATATADEKDALMGGQGLMPSADQQIDVGMEGIADKKPQAQGYISFRNLCYDVDVPAKSGHGKEKRRLLNNVFGYSKPGEMVALMGASVSKEAMVSYALASIRLCTLHCTALHYSTQNY
jgi:hypothetical protein